MKSLVLPQKLIAFSLLALGLSLAQPRVAQAQNLVTDRGLFLIDQGLYDEAIFTLGREVQINPDNFRARILLASSFAAKNGIVVTRFTAIAREVLALTKAPPPPGENPPSPLQVVMTAFEKIPALPTPQAVADIQQAIAALDGPGIQRGALLFRATLKVVLFKFNYYNSNLIRPETGCKIDAQEYEKWMLDLEAQLQSAVADVQNGMADPQIKAQIEKVKVNIHETMTGMATSVDDYSDDPDLMPDDMKKSIELCQSK